MLDPETILLVGTGIIGIFTISRDREKKSTCFSCEKGTDHVCQDLHRPDTQGVSTPLDASPTAVATTSPS